MNEKLPATDRRSLLKFALLGLLAGCRPVGGQGLNLGSGSSSSETGDSTTGAKSANDFAIDLQKRLAADQGNLIFSPASLAIALGMAAAGAEKETRDEMLSVLHAPEDETNWLKSIGKLSHLLNAEGENYVIKTANRLWGQMSFEFRDDYLAKMEKDFGAPCGKLDFIEASEPSRMTINNWVSDQTNSRIKDLLPSGSITHLTRLVLTNAIYFKADWASKFMEFATTDQPFKCFDGSEVQVPLMMQKNTFGYAEDDDVQVVELPYINPDLSMAIVVPKQVDGLKELEQQLTSSRLNSWFDSLGEQEVVVFLPKFKLEVPLNLNSILCELGMPRAFGDEAEFGGISTSAPLKITDVVHKAFVEVDEEGTEAAAATGVVIGMRGPAPQEPEPKIVRADHPFVFLIRHRESGAILFWGRLAQPV